jgi:hypothetical protein
MTITSTKYIVAPDFQGCFHESQTSRKSRHEHFPTKMYVFPIGLQPSQKCIQAATKILTNFIFMSSCSHENGHFHES